LFHHFGKALIIIAGHFSEATGSARSFSISVRQDE